MRKYLSIFVGLFILLGSLTAISLALAENENENTAAQMIKPIIKDIEEKELRQELSIKEIQGRIICRELNACPGVKPSVEVLVKAAKVTEVGADYLKISIFGITYKVDTSLSKIVRHYWGASEIDEFSVGDIVNVYGYLDEADSYLIRAKTVRNVSIQKIHNVFKGVIESIDASSTSFILKTEERGNQTVMVSGETKIIKPQPVLCVKAPCLPVEIAGSFSDLRVGMKAIVRGLWDKALSKIQARVIVIGEEKGARPFFQKALPLKVEKLEGKIEKFIQKGERKLGESAESIRAKIEEIQRKINEILEKLRTATTTQ